MTRDKILQRLDLLANHKWTTGNSTGELARATVALLDEVREVLEQCEFTLQAYPDGESYTECPVCYQSYGVGHTPDCRLSALLSRLKKGGTS